MQRPIRRERAHRSLCNRLARVDVEAYICDYVEHELSSGRDAKVVALVEEKAAGQVSGEAGIDSFTGTTVCKATVFEVNRTPR